MPVFPLLHLARFLFILALVSDCLAGQDPDLRSLSRDTSGASTIQPSDTTETIRVVQNRGAVFAGDSLEKSPWGAVVRSLVVPGWGQWYNERKWKAPLVLASDAVLLGIYFQRDKRVDRIQGQRSVIDRQLKTDPFLTEEKRRILQARFNDLTGDLDAALNRRNLFGWLFAISHLLGMVDAYTDAHLYRFDEKIEMSMIPTQEGYHLSMTWLIR